MPLTVAASGITFDDLTTLSTASISAFNIAAEAITSVQLSANAVTTEKIALSAVTTDTINDGAVTTAKIALGAVITEDLADGAVTAAKLNGGQSGSAPIYGCRAWVNFDGLRNASGGSDTLNTNRFIRSSGNVTSVLRNGLGDYTITFTTAMANANYSVVATTGTTGTSTNALIAYELNIGSRSVSFVRIAVGNNEIDQFGDAPQICVQVFGN